MTSFFTAQSKMKGLLCLFALLGISLQAAPLPMTDVILTAPFENQRGIASFEINNGGVIYSPAFIAAFNNAASGFASPVSAGWNLQPTPAVGLSSGNSGPEARSAMSDAYVTTNAFALRDGSVFDLNTTVNDADGRVFYVAEHGGNDNNITVRPLDSSHNLIGTWTLVLNGAHYAAITTAAEYSRNSGGDTAPIAATTFSLADFTGGAGILTGVTALRIDGDLRLDPAQVGVASVIPEPSSMLLLGLGLAAVLAFRRRKLNNPLLNSIHKQLLAGGVITALMVVTPFSTAFAAFQKVDDFEGGISGWSTGAGASFTAVTDPEDSGNTVARFQGNNAVLSDTGYAVLDLAGGPIITGGSIGTLYLRAYMEGSDVDTVFGLGDTGPGATTLNWNAFRSAGRLDPDFDVRDGNSYDPATSDTNTGDWYHFWFVINHTTDRTDFYIQSDTDPDFATQTKVFSNAAFRNTGAGDLDFLLLKSGDTTTNSILFDDIHIDTTGENLAVVPEPSAILLMGLALITAGIFLKRKK